jgi:heme/copper-type cytochrome/quinol oxidase subunit 2
LAIQKDAAVGGTLTPDPETTNKQHSKLLLNVFVSLLVIVIFTLMLYICCRWQAKAKHNAALKRVAEYEQRKRLEGLDEEGEYVMSSGSAEDDHRTEPMLP